MSMQSFEASVVLLQKLIATESISKHEDQSALVLVDFLKQKGIQANRDLNNVWVKNKHYDANKPTILLNSHHDTVKPNSFYTRNPFAPTIEDGKLYGLGSNDAGGCLVALLAAFLYFYEQADLKYNLIYSTTAEEEISGKNGVQALLPLLGNIDFGIVGEPTGMDMAIAEKGLMVIDCISTGKAAHIASDEGENAIYKAMRDIDWVRTYQFAKHSDLLGPVKMSVSLINGGIQHNVVPDTCKFTIDIRSTNEYTHSEILEIIKSNTSCSLTPRSTHLEPSFISEQHPLIKAVIALGKKTFGSATLSDQALMKFPTIKMGPGDTKRSHSADEFIYLHEIEAGIQTYINLLKIIL